MNRPTLETLRSSLQQRMRGRLPEHSWAGPSHMAGAADRISLLLGDVLAPVINLQRLSAAVHRLRRGEALSDTELRLCCTGATTPAESGGQTIRIIDDDGLTVRLVEHVASRDDNPRMRRRCAFGLAHAILLPSERPIDIPGDNSDKLASCVHEYASRNVPLDESRKLLAEVVDLFADGSTRRFWPSVLQRDESSVIPLHRLGTPATSWIWRQILVDAVNECASWSNAQFVQHIDPVLEAMVNHPTALDEGLGMILDRLARIPSAAEHTALKDLAVERWGSPLIRARHPYWFRWVTEAARRMVAGWLTRRVIARFFESLAGPDADPRRTAFWSRYADRFDEVWLYLSEESRYTGGEAIREIRSALGPAARSIDDDHTNAFVMMVGRYAFVEFSTTGNALYVYDRAQLPFELDRGRPMVSAMKDRDAVQDRLVHVGRWEERARDRVGNLTGEWVQFI